MWYPFLFLLSLCVVVVESKDGEIVAITIEENKFRNREPVNIEQYFFAKDTAEEAECHVPVDILWKAELPSQLYSTPTLYDLNA
jgi:hypothetical protein